jgi:RecB family exonuclease
MQDFLDQVTDHILESKGQLHRKLIVLPSRRAALFMRQKIQDRSTKSLLMPAFMAQEDLMQEISGLYIPERMELLTLMFRHYKELMPNGDDIGRFLQWGATLLQDFNEIDRNLVDGDVLYRHLFDIKEIEQWDPDGDSEMVEHYLQFWDLMGRLYRICRTEFLKEGMAWPGLAFSEAARKLSTDEGKVSEILNADHIYFVGLNALTRAEEAVLDKLEERGQATFFFDYDLSYLEDKEHEAGFFARKNLKRKKISHEKLNWCGDHYGTFRKTLVRTYSASDPIGQCKIVQRILEDTGERIDQETAILLSDEELLIPMLYSIPENISDINVTMGMPLKKTSLGQFLIRLIGMYRDSLRRSKAGGSPWQYHFKAFLRLLNSPESGLLIDPTKRSVLIDELNKEIRVQISPLWIREQLGEGDSLELSELLQEWNSEPQVFLDRLVGFLEKVREKGPDLEAAMIGQMAKLIQRLQNLLIEHEEFGTPELLLDLLEDAIRNEKVDLYGEPLKGVQLMGLLESRAIDFKRVIILSVNEGILPSGKTVNSYIPYDIKKHYKIPVFTDKDAIFAYHFYRCLHRAEEIHLLYHTDHGGLGSGEPSRFIRQIRHEWPKRFVSEIENIQLTSPLGESAAWSGINIPKTEQVRTVLESTSEYGFSPTSLSQYIADPVEFYFRYVLKLKELEEVEEDLGALTLGTVIHDTLENFFKPLEGVSLDSEHIDFMLNNLDSALMQSFQKEYKKEQLKRGRNVLIHFAFRELLEQFLTAQKKKIIEGNKIVFVEAEASIALALKSDSGTEFKLRGKVDRIEQQNDRIIITDYKTGSIDEYELRLKSLEEAFEPKGAKAFQLLCYSLMYWRSHPGEAIGSPRMISLRQPDKEFVLLIDKEELNESTLVEFEGHLGRLIDEIMDQDQPFTTDFESKYPAFTKLWS